MTKNPTNSLEVSFLGAILNPLTTARVMALVEKRHVTEAWFDSAEAKRVWQSVEELWRKHRAVDGVLVMQALGQYPEAVYFLKHCIELAPTLLMATQVVETFVTRHMRSLALRVGQQLSSDAMELSGQEAIAKAESAIVAFHDAERTIYGQGDVLQTETSAILADYELLHQKRVLERDEDFYIGCQLPWQVLNHCYMGVKPGIHIIAARPSQGKTALAVTMSAGMAAKGTKQLFFSLDMARRELIKRYGSLLGNVSLSRLELGGSAADLNCVKRGIKLFRQLGSASKTEVNNIQISTSYHVERIIGDIYRAVKCEGVQCVWIDYLQLVSSSKRGTQKEVIDDVLAQLKQCALELEIPIFCLCQLNRETGKDPDRKPNLTDLGDSGKIERDASTVLVLWKDSTVRELWDRYPPLPLAGNQEGLVKVLEPMWLLLLKNQQGATRSFPFIFYKNTFMFRPSNHDATATKVEIDGKQRHDFRPFFSHIRDDFMILEKPDGTGLDDRIRKAGALGKRGL